MLLQHATVEHGDAVCERHRFDLVVGDVDRGHPQFVVQGSDARPHLMAKLRVQVRERLVHEQHLWPLDEGAAERNPLTLTS